MMGQESSLQAKLFYHQINLEQKVPKNHFLRKILNIFPEERFEYDRDSDTYRCPAGNRLKPKSFHAHRQSRDYAAPKKICASCYLREQCTRNKSGRTIKRHLRQEDLERMREASRSAKWCYWVLFSLGYHSSKLGFLDIF